MFRFLICFIIFLIPWQQNQVKNYFKESNFKLNKNNQTLFVIERNKNSNTIYYDANLSVNGKLNPSKPIDVYYIHYATDSKRAELSLLEQNIAYGFTFEKNSIGGFYIKLKAYKKRYISLFQDVNNKAYAIMKINGTDALIKKIYVFAKPNLYTSVVYVELNGEDIKTHAPVYEKILNY